MHSILLTNSLKRTKTRQ